MIRTDTMSATPREGLSVGDLDLWEDGPPHELFRQLRSECPVHWSPDIPYFPTEAGFWSVTRWDDIHAVSRDWQTFSSAHGIPRSPMRSSPSS